MSTKKKKKRADALAEIDRAKSVFFSNVSHEFRTPLTLMLSPLEEALADDSPLSAPPQRERVRTAHSNGLRLLKLVNNLLDFARVDAGSVTTIPQPTDLAALTEDLVSVFRSAFEASGIELVTGIEPVGLLDVDVDMWETTVLNLVSNALKYTLHGSVRVELHGRADAVELSVADTGVGIAVEEQDRVFERFFRSANEAGRSFEGIGIGLALVSELREAPRRHYRGGQHAGPWLDVQCELAGEPQRWGEGGRHSRRSSSSRPRAFAVDAQRWVDHTPAERELDVDDADRDTVLVVDDNGDMRRYLRSLLDPEWRVRLASTGREALELARRERPDLVVSDVMMPDIDGLRLVDQLRADDELRDTPVMLLSGRAGPEATVDGLSRGADDYLVKPFSAGELRARLRALLRSAHDEFHRRQQTPWPGVTERRTSLGCRRPFNLRGPCRRSWTGRSRASSPSWGLTCSRSLSSSATSPCSACIAPGPRFRCTWLPVTCGRHSTPPPPRPGRCRMGWHAGSSISTPWPASSRI